jgi:non-specific serine/threonine protein kinase
MTTAIDNDRYLFGEFELQPRERRLLRGGEAVQLGANAFDVLVALIDRSGHLVTKDELLQRVWPNRVVGENTLQVHISALRKLLAPGSIATVSGRGYRFEAAVGPLAPDVSASIRLHNIPLELTSFVGRAHELAEIEALLPTARLLTLTGAGGCGKTRLGLELAARHAATVPGGVWLVELASLTAPDQVSRAVADALGIRNVASEDLRTALVERLSLRPHMLVLDNAEHLVQATAELASHLARHVPELSMLVTSRERLGVPGETSYRVPSLSVPAADEGVSIQLIAQFDSVQLFVDRARLHRPEFVLTPENAEDVSAICRLLDGIPLALELAAARLRSLSVAEVRKRLGQRFTLLSNPLRTPLNRHKTLRALVDWSYDLLSSDEKSMLAQVSVFQGGWTLEALEATFQSNAQSDRSVLDVLTALVDKSLVICREAQSMTRYGMLDTVRRYASDRLEESGQAAEVHRRHLDYFQGLAAKTAPLLAGNEEESSLELLTREYDNIRHALAWAAVSPGSGANGLALSASLAMFWTSLGHLSEGRNWLDRFLALAECAPPNEVRARALRGAGMLALRQSDYSAAWVALEEGLGLHRQLGNQLAISQALNNLGSVAVNLGDFAKGKSLYQESLAIRRQLNDFAGIALILNNLAIVALDEGDLLEAQRMSQECVDLQRTFGSPSALALALTNLGHVVRDLKDLPRAHSLLTESLNIWVRLGSRLEVAETLESFSPLACDVGQPLIAATLWGQAQRIRSEVGAVMPPRALPSYEKEVALARTAQSDQTAFDAAWALGKTLSVGEAAKIARELVVQPEQL